MKTMKKMISLLMSVIMIFSSVPVGALATTVAAPAALTVIQEEAFAGMSQLSGLLTLPENVTAIGRNAFDGTGLYALELPSGMQTVADQGDTSLAYVYVHGSQTELEGSGWTKYVFADEGSAAQTWAAEEGVSFVDAASLAAHEGFYYQLEQDGTAALLCAADEKTVPAKVVIPDAVNEHTVTVIGSDAFMGCEQIETIIVPADAVVAENAYAGAPEAAVFVKGEAAKLRIEAVDSVWPWSGKGKVRIAADRPAELLSQRSANVEMRVHVGKEYDMLGKSQIIPIVLDDNGEAIVEIAADSYMMVEAIVNGYTHAAVELVSVEETSAFTISADSAMIMLPLADLAQETDPIFSAESADDSQTILEFVAGKEHKQKIVANNPYVTEGVYTIQVCTADGAVVGTTEINLAETREAVISFRIPESLINQEAEIAYYYQAAEAAELFCFATDARSVVSEPETVIVTNPLALESEHDQSGLINTMWKYAVDGAVALNVTFDMALSKNAYLRVGSQREMDLDTARFFIGRTANDQTVTFTGSEVVFWLRATPESAENWGFKVKGIVANMADGSQIRILDPDAAVPANLNFLQAAQGLRGSWDAVPGAAAYEVYVQREGETEYKYVETNSGEPVTTNSIDTIAFFTQEQCGVLNYAVCAVFADGSRSQLSAPFQMIALAPPTMVSARQTGETSFTLVWESVENAQSYRIFSGTPATGFTVVASGLTDTTHVINLLPDADRDAVYSYYVQAFGPFGPGVQGQMVTFNGLKDNFNTEIVLSATGIVLDAENKTYLLQAEVVSETLTDKSVRYISLNPNIAAVDENGLITAVSGGTTYIAVTAADGTAARCCVTVDAERCVVNIAQAPAFAVHRDVAEITLAYEGIKPTASDVWQSFEITYLAANGTVIKSENIGYVYEGENTYEIWLDCYGAARAQISIVNNEWFQGGENASVEIAFTTTTVDVPDCTIEFIASDFYPGGLAQVYIKLNNPEVLSEPLPVSVNSLDGQLAVYVGTLSAEQTELRADIPLPTAWKYYDQTENTEYEVRVNIGFNHYYTHWFAFYGFSAEDVTVPVGHTVERWEDDYCWITAELPLTFTVADPSIASINEEGSVTGLKVGETTATVTTQSGASLTFAISVVEPSEDDDLPQVPGKPAVYIYAPHEKVEIIPGEWQEYFLIAAEVPETIENTAPYYVHVGFLDENREEIRTYMTYEYPYGENIISVGFHADEFEPDVRYIELGILPEDAEYTVSSPDYAIVELIHPYAGDENTPKFDLPVLYGGDRYQPGQTFSIPVKCTTPELINGSVTLNGVLNNGVSQVASISTLTLTPDSPNGNLEVTLSENAIGGEWVQIFIYAGTQKIGSYDFNIGNGLSVMTHDLWMFTGTTREMPLRVADYISKSDLTFTSHDEEVASIDANGLITAKAAGETYITVSYTNKYGFFCAEEIWLCVYQAAEEDLPAATMSTNVTEVFFGDPIPLTFKLERGCVQEYDQNVAFKYWVSLLDANMNTIGSRWGYASASMENAVAGFETSMKAWPSTDLLQEAAYLRLAFVGDTEQVSHYLPQDNTFLIRITGFPEPGQMSYTIELDSEPPYYAGDHIGINVQRFEATSYYPRAAWELKDADGNVYAEDMFFQDYTSVWTSLDSNGLAPLQNHTLYLYVDGEKTNASISFYVEEPRLGVDYSNRISLNGLGKISAYFYGEHEYDAAVTFTSTNESVLTVSADGTITPVGIGVAEIIATTEGGQSVSALIMVYDPNSIIAPELYLAEMGEGNADVRWFSSMPFILGTTTDLYRVSGSLYASYKAEFLNANGDVVAECSQRNSLYHSMLNQQQEVWRSIPAFAWRQAFAEGAVQVRLTLMHSEEYAYSLAPGRSSLTFDLPPAAEHNWPVVSYTFTEAVNPGGEFSATFTCHNPAALIEARQVKLYNDETGEQVASGYLTASNPQVTLTWQVPAEWKTHDNVALEYPSPSRNSSITDYVTTYVSSFNGFTIEQRIAVGNDSVVYPSYNGNPPAVTYASLNENIAVVEPYGGYGVRIIGIAPGVAEITATSGSTTVTAKAVVCDFNNTELPVLYLDQSQNGMEAVWNDETEVRVMTSTAPERIGDGIYANFRYEYLDANGAVLETSTDRQYNYALFADGSETFYCDLDAGEACARGASAVRVTLMADAYDYLLAQNDLSVTFAISGIENAEEPVFVLVADNYGRRGEEYTAKVVCLNPEKMTGDYTVSVDFFFDEVEYTINAANPEAAFSIAPQDNSGIDLNVSIQGANNFNQYMYQYVQLLDIDMHDMVVAVGDGVSADQFTFNQPAPVYSIADESIATIDPNTGMITGVSAGSTTVTVRFGNLTTSASVRLYDPSAAENTLVTLEASEAAAVWPWTAAEENSYMVTIKANNALEKLAGEMTGTIYIDFYDDYGNRVWEQTYSKYVSARFVNSVCEDVKLDLNDVAFAQIAQRGATKARVYISGLWPSAHYSSDSSYVEIPMQDLTQLTNEPLIYVVSRNLTSTLYYGNTYTIAFVAGNPYAEGEYEVSIQVDDYSAEDYMARDVDLPNRVISSGKIVPRENPVTELSFTASRDLTPYSSIWLQCFAQPADGSAPEQEVGWFNRSLAEAPNYTPVTELTDLQSEHNYANNAKQYLSYTYENAVRLDITLDDQSQTESSCDFLSIGTYDEMLSDTFANRLSGSIGGRTITVEGDTAYFKFTSDYSGSYWGFMVESIVATMADGSQVMLVNPYSNLVPELYLAEPETDAQWFTNLPMLLGTSSPLDYIADSVYLQYQLDMLNADGQVITNGPSNYGTTYALTAQEQEYNLYIEDALWQTAFEQNAVQIRLSLLNSDDESYTIDPERSSVTYQLPDLGLHPYPIITYTASNEVCVGGDFSATFTCLNPAALNNPCEVALYDYRYNTLAASGYLTAEEPEITLNWQIPADWSTYSQIELRYPSRSGEGTVSTTIRPTVYHFKGFAIDDRIAVGSNRVFYPQYSGNYPPIVYTSLDESVATVELYNGYCAKVTGVAPGVADITATCAGKTFATKVVVYDRNNLQKPVMYLDQSQNGSEAAWGEPAAIKVCTSTDPALIDRPGDYFNVDFKYEWLDENGAVLATFAKRNSQYTAFAYGWTDFILDLAADEAYASGARSIRVTLMESEYNYTLAEADLSVTLMLSGVEAVQEPVFVLLANDYARKDVQYTAKLVCLNPEMMAGDYTVTVNDNGYNEAVYTMNADSPELTFTMSPRNSSNIVLNVRIQDVNSTFYKGLHESISLVDISMHGMVVAVGSTVSADQFYVSELYPVYAIEDESIATVDPDTGLITGVSAGTTTVNVDLGYGLSNSALVRVYDRATAEKLPLTLEASAYAPAWPWKSDALNQHWFTVKANGDSSKLGAPANFSVTVEFYDDEDNKVGDSTYWQTVGANFIGTMSENIRLDLSHILFAQLAAAGATKARVAIGSMGYECRNDYSYDEDAYVDIPMADLSQMTDEPLLYVDDDNLPDTLFYDCAYSVAFTAGNPYAEGTYKVSIQTDDPKHYGSKMTLAEAVWDLEEGSPKELSFTVTKDQVPYTYLDLEYYIQPEDDSAEPVLFGSEQYSLATKPVYTPVSNITELQSEHDYANNTKLCLSYTYENAVSLQITLDEDSNTESNYDFLSIGDYNEMLTEAYANRFSGFIGGKTVTVSGDTAYFRFTSDGSSVRWGFRVKTIVATMADGSQVTISNPYCGFVPEMYLAHAEEASESVGWYGTLPAVLGTTSDVEFISDDLEIYYHLELLDANGDVIDDIHDPYSPYSVFFEALEQEQECELEMSSNLWNQAFEKGAVQIRVVLANNYDDSYSIQPEHGAITLNLAPYEDHPYPIVTFELPEVVVPGGELFASFTCHNPACLTAPRRVALHDDRTDECVATGYLTAENPQVTLTWQLPEDWDEDCYVKLEHPVPYDNGIAIRPLSPSVLKFNGFEINDRVVKGDYRVFYPDLNGAAYPVTYSSSDESIATVEPYDSYGSQGVKVNGIAPGVAAITATCAGKSFTAKVVVYDPLNVQKPVLYLDQSHNTQEAVWGKETPIRIRSTIAPEQIEHPYNGTYMMQLKCEWLDENGEPLLAVSKSYSTNSKFADGWADIPCELYADEAFATGAKSIRVTLLDYDYHYTLAENDLSVTMAVPGIENTQEPVFVLVADDYVQKNTVYSAKVVCLTPERMDGAYTVSVNYDDFYTITPESPEVTFTASPQSDYSIFLNVYIYNDDNTFYKELKQTVTLVDIAMRNMLVAVGDTISADQFSYSNLCPVFSIADESIASIDSATGLITGVSAGTTSVNVKFSYNLSNSILLRVYDPNSAEITPLSLGASMYFPEWTWSDDPTSPHMLTITANGDRDKLGGIADVEVEIEFCDDEGNKAWSTTKHAQASFVGTASDNVKFDFSNVPFPQIAAAGATKARVRISELYFNSSTYYSFDPDAYIEIPMKDLSQMPDEMLLFVDASTLPNVLYYGNTYSVSFVAGNPYAAGKYKVSLQARDDSYYGHYDVITEAIWEPSKSSVMELDFVTSMALAPDGYLRLACFIQPEDGSESPVKLCENEYHVMDEADIPVYTQVDSLAELQSEHNYENDTELRLSYTVENAVKLEIQLHENSRTENEWDYLYFADFDSMLLDDFVYKVSGPLGRGIFTIYDDTVYIRFTSDSSNTDWGFAVSSIKATMSDGTIVMITE